MLVVDFHVGNRERHGTGSQYHVLGRGGIAVAVVRADLHLAFRKQLAATVDEFDLVGLEQLDQPAGELLDDLAFALEHLVDVDGHALGADSVGGVVVLNVMEVLGRVQQRLRRNAAHVQAGAPRRGFTIIALAVVDQHRLQSKLGRANGTGITAWAATDEDYVEFVVRHDSLPILKIGLSVLRLRNVDSGVRFKV